MLIQCQPCARIFFKSLTSGAIVSYKSTQISLLDLPAEAPAMNAVASRDLIGETNLQTRVAGARDSVQLG